MDMLCTWSPEDVEEHPAASPARLNAAEHLTLALFPLAAMTDGAGGAEVPDVVEYETVQHTPQGRLTQHWTVRAAAGKTLPTADDIPFLLGLLTLHHQHGFGDPRVEFTPKRLFDLLELAPRADTYRRLRDALTRLLGVSIESSNAIYGQHGRWESHDGFHIVEQYRLFDGRSGHPSYVKWGEYFHATLLRGDVRPLDLRIYLDLKRPTSRSLFRLLEHYRAAGHRHVAFTADDLRQRLCMAGCSGAVLNQRLKSAHDQLVAAGVLASVAYKAERFTYALADPIRADLHDHLTKRLAPPMSPIVAADLLLRYGPLKILLALDYADYETRGVGSKAAWIVASLRDGYDLLRRSPDEPQTVAALLNLLPADERTEHWLRARRICGIPDDDLLHPLDHPDTWPLAMRAAFRFLVRP